MSLVVGQALGLRRPPRPPGRAFNKLQWVVDRARVLQDPLFAQQHLADVDAGRRVVSIVVCAEPGSWQQAGRFVAKALGDVDLRSFEDLRRRAPVQPILVYLTHPDYDHLRSLLEILKPASPDVVIYYATRAAPEEAAQLSKLVGETRPNHTSVVFEVKAAAASVLGHSRSSGRRNGTASSANRTRRLREHFGLTQTELAHSLGVSLRTAQNWERDGVAGSPPSTSGS